MGFDVAGAKAAGYSDAEIADHLAQTGAFDVQGARQAGYSDAEILDGFQQPASPAEAPYNPTDDMSTGERTLAGIGMGMSRAGRAVGQAFGLVDQSQIDEAKALEAPLEATKAGRYGGYGGTAAFLAPTALIPGANTYAGAALIGAGSGALATEGGLKDRALGLAGGLVGGAGGLAAGRGIAAGGRAALDSRVGRGATEAASNAVRDATLAASRAAGYVLPPSETMGPGLARGLLQRLEGLGGKAALGQDASIANRATTNTLARRGANIAGEGQISGADLDAAKAPLFATYEEAAQISPDAAEAVQLWRQSNNDAKQYQRFYNTSNDPAAQTRADAARADADTYFQVISDEATRAGRPELAQQLAEARVGLARIGSVEDALNDATGEVSARELAKQANRGVPLSGELLDAARFAQAYPRFAQDAGTTSLPGVSNLQGLGSVALGAAGGPLLAALPFVTPTVRAALLSRALQSTANPTYGPSALTRGLLNSTRIAPQAGAISGQQIGLTIAPSAYALEKYVP